MDLTISSGPDHTWLNLNIPVSIRFLKKNSLFDRHGCTHKYTETRFNAGIKITGYLWDQYYL